jgi:SAM-dependent methyltransferase
MSGILVLSLVLPAEQERRSSMLPSRSSIIEDKVFLHVGCGASRKEHTTPAFSAADWREIRLDIDQAVNPDVVGTMADMSVVLDASVDAIFSSHNIEHLYPQEVPLALAEFLRVLKPDGFAIITCPDLRSVAALVTQDKLTDTAYLSSRGPIAPLDILYGFRPDLARGNLFMAHRCGFTEKVLVGTLFGAGFESVISLCRPRAFDLWAAASKAKVPEAQMRQLAGAHFPH